MFESIKDFFRGIAFNTKAFATLVLMCILFIICFIIPGAYLLIKKHTLNYKSDGTIMNSRCQQSEVDPNEYVCNLTVEYPANDRTYTGVNVNDVTTNQNEFTIGNSIPVYYDRDNPRAFIIRQYRLKTIAITLLCIGTILILMSLASYSLKYRKEVLEIDA